VDAIGPGISIPLKMLSFRESSGKIACEIILLIIDDQ
jgi:hypothetical protein